MTKDRPLIVAHRGASELAPENTLAAFARALADGADGIEFDARLTADGEVVVFHDANLARIAGSRTLISALTADQIGEFDVGSWFGRRFPNKANAAFSAERIPTLAAALKFLEDFSGIVFIELKCRESEIEALSKAVCQIIAASPLLPRIIVKSFQLEAIPTVKKFCPAVKTAALFAPKILTILRKEKRLVNIADELGADLISIHYSLATKKLMKKAARKNLPVVIWTANNERWLKRAASLGIYAVITNNPARLLLLARRAD